MPVSERSWGLCGSVLGCGAALSGSAESCNSVVNSEVDAEEESSMPYFGFVTVIGSDTGSVACSSTPFLQCSEPGVSVSLRGLCA